MFWGVFLMSQQYEYTTTPYSDERVDNIYRQEGVVDQLEVLALDVPDTELVHNLHQRIEDSLAYWNKATSYNLKVRRDKNVDWHRGHHRDKTYMFAYQVPYTDNEIFVGVEAIVSYLTAQAARTECWPGNSRPESRIFAQDLEDVLNQLANLNDLREESENIVRDLLLKFLGVMKFWIDPQTKKIKFGSVDPNNLIIDKNVRKGQNPAFICQVIKTSVGELIATYPHKKKEIIESLGRMNASAKLMAQTVVYREVWFTSWKDGKPTEGVAAYFQNVVLEKAKNPHYNYSNPDENILSYPMKPFIPFNFINDGSHWIDSTSPVEQAGPLQEILNKRGQQILENADTANGVMAFDAKAINSDAAANLTGDPNQKILLEANKHGMRLRDAIMQLPPHLLPNYVIEDKADLRQTIHNILGTPSQFTGTNAQDDRTDTLGEAMMVKNQATGRQDAIVRALSSGYQRFFQYYAQMIKVWMTEKELFAIKGKDGQFVDVEMHSDRIENDVQIVIEDSSFLPPDKHTTANIALNLAKLGLTGPRYLYKDLGLKEVKDRLEDLVNWKTNPMSVVVAESGSEDDRNATVDFTDLINGRKVQVRQDVTPEYLNTLRKFMLSPQFREAKLKYQQAYVAFVQAETSILDQQSLLDEMSQQDAAAHTLPLSPQGGMPPGMPQGMPQGPPGAPPMPPAPQGQQLSMPPQLTAQSLLGGV